MPTSDAEPAHLRCPSPEYQILIGSSERSDWSLDGQLSADGQRLCDATAEQEEDVHSQEPEKSLRDLQEQE